MNLVESTMLSFAMAQAMKRATADGRQEHPDADRGNDQNPIVQRVDPELHGDGVHHGDEDDHRREPLQDCPEDEEDDVAQQEKNQGELEMPTTTWAMICGTRSTVITQEKTVAQPMRSMHMAVLTVLARMIVGRSATAIRL